MGMMQEMNIPAGLVKQVTELIEDPQLKSRNMIVDVDHPKLGKVKTFNTPIKFFEARSGVQPGENPDDPELGEHTSQVLKELLGFKDEDIARLRKERVIWA
jgi:crotonobetainyl-CoA:carnitine CoA-transferase CaiB-like acyl-CoA transferase